MPESQAVVHTAIDPHALSTSETAVRWDVDAARGLSEADATARTATYGRNVIEQARGDGWLRRLLAQLHNPLIYVLLAAGAVTAAFGEYVDAGVIAGVVLLNAVIGYVQESRCWRSVSA